MSRTEAELAGLLGQAGQMPYGEAQTSAMEDVVRHADAAGYRRLAFEARRRLADAAEGQIQAAEVALEEIERPVRAMSQSHAGTGAP